MRAIILGTGTSYGIPVLGCDCHVCKSTNKKNKRLRSSALISYNDKNILIDTSPDLRTQLLEYPVKRIDSVLYTHHHADHLFGLDDLRIYNRIQNAPIPCYGSEITINAIKKTFYYIFDNATPKGGGLPNIELHNINAPFSLFDKQVTPISVMHGNLPILGFRWDKFAYVTDCSFMPSESRGILSGLDALVINGLRFKPHSTHQSIPEAVNIIEEIKPKKAYITHLSHEIDHDIIDSSLPDNIFLAYDGLQIDLP